MPRWVGSVLPHGAVDGPGDLVRRVVAAEEFYAALGTTTRFQISPGTGPEGLDAVLSERGYHRESAMSLRVASTARVLEQLTTKPGALRVYVDDRPTRAWFDVWHAVHGAPGADRRFEWDLLDRVARPSAYVRAMLGDEVVAVSRAVADAGWAGVFGMATLSRARGKGAARAVLAALADWASAHAADQMYLQVERDNTPALRLYERAGFDQLCGYHYRTDHRQDAS